MTSDARPIVLDTSAYSRFRRGDPRVVEAIAQAVIVYLTATIIGELLAGFRLGSRERANRQVLDDFCNEAFVRVVAVTSATAEHYARLFAELRRAGTPIPLNDVWIAASSFELGARVVTADSDFSRVQGLDVIDVT